MVWPHRRFQQQWQHRARALIIVLLGCVMGWGALPLLVAKPSLLNREHTSRAVLSDDGLLVRITLTGDHKYRLFTPINRIAPALRDAVINYEDRWFWYHPGVNPLALVRATAQNVAAYLTARPRRPLGASTITMQLARARFDLRTRSLWGKVKQVLHALLLERFYSKEELLEGYLNTVSYGGNVEGIGAASWLYFHHSARDLSEIQAHLLALVPQNPAQRDPQRAASGPRLEQAWRRVYPGETPVLAVHTRRELPRLAPHFVERLAPLTNGVVHTGLSLSAQRTAERSLSEYLDRNRSLGITNGAILVVDSRTMQIRAYVGSAGFTNRIILGFVNGCRAPRSPGSLLKPLLYGAAIDQGIITPDTLLKDSPLRIAHYSPENFERNFLGPLSATEALVRSRNVPAIDLAARLANPGWYDLLKQCGFILRKPPGFYGLSLALGSFDVTLEQIVAAYAMLRSDGYYRPLSFTEPSAEPGIPVLSPEAAYLVLAMLQKNPPPGRLYGSRSFSEQTPIAWKTGTSFGSRDAWAVGILGHYIAGVWLGNFAGTPNPNLVGRDAAGPLLFSLLEGIRAETNLATTVARPPRLKRVTVCSLSGALASSHCPHRRNGWIIPGVSPITHCSVHREVFVDTRTGYQVCGGGMIGHGGPGIQRMVVEVWDSDLMKLFQLGGLARRPPPPVDPACQQVYPGNGVIEGTPRIVSPQRSVVYQVREHTTDPLELTAVLDGAHQQAFWFVDDELVGIGSSARWQPRPGRFTARVVDDRGRVAKQEFVVQWARQ